VASILLLVEDISIRTLLSIVLQNDGHTVWQVSAPDEAAGICSGILVDVIIADIVLQGHRRSTELALTLVRAQPNIRVLFITGWAIDPLPDLRNLQQLPTRSYLILTKPFDPSALLQHIHMLLEGSQLADRHEAASAAGQHYLEQRHPP
jgi:DNA-binding NtrC family response regulator